MNTRAPLPTGRVRRLSGPNPEYVLLAVLTLLGLYIRLYALDVVGLWWDEFVTLGRAAWPLRDMLPSLAFQGPSDVSLDSSPPLYHLLVHGSLLLLPATDVAVKLPSVIAGTLTIPVAWLVGRRFFSPQTGIAAAGLCALSLFHIHYSREARPYAIYLLFALLGLYFLRRALDSGRARDWAGFAVANIFMFYASYLASATFFAEGLFVLGQAAWLWRADRPAARRLLVRAGLAAALVLIAYLPWLPAHLFQVRTIHTNGPTGDRFDSAGFLAVLKAFAAMYYQGGAPWPLALAGLCALGLIRHLAMGRRAALIALGLWSVSALVMAAALPTQIHVSIRYLVNLFFLFVFLAGGGIEAIASLACRRLPQNAALACVAALAVVCSLPTFMTLPIYVKRDSPSIKSVLAGLLVDKDNANWLLFYRNRHLKIVSDWYLHGAFQTAAALPDRRYRRFDLLTPDDLVDKRQLPGLLPVRRTFWADIAKGGVVNRAPLPLDAPYASDFSDLSFYADCYQADNMAPDLGYKTLGLYDCRRPGRAVFAFAAPAGARAGQAKLALGLQLRPGKASLPESRLTVSAGTSLTALSPLASATAADFRPGQDRLDLDVSLPAPDPATGLVFVAIDLAPGHVDGFLELASLTLTPPIMPLPPGTPPLWKRRAAAIAANTRVLPGLAAAATLGGDVLFGFADAPEADLHLGGPEAKAAYLAAYPGDTPVAVVTDATGATRVGYFDPGLRHPFTPLTQTPRDVLPGFGRGLVARGLWARGAIAGQTLSVGDTAVTLPVNAPAGSRLLLDANGPGLLHFSPGYDRPLPDILGETFLSHGLRPVPGQPALTCAGDAPCFLTYAVTATPGRRPLAGFRLAWYPRVLTDGTGHNRVTVTYSTDGATYRPLGELRSKGEFFWYGGAMRMAREVSFPRPADRLYVRFALSGGGAELWSAPQTRLGLDVRLADTGFAGLPLPAGPIPAHCDGPACAVLPTRDPPALGGWLRERL